MIEKGVSRRCYDLWKGEIAMNRGRYYVTGNREVFAEGRKFK